MKKRGFTLIELLAVIVILAIIALIAVPSVLNIIEDSRKGAAEASARNIVSTAKTYYMSETMNERTIGIIDLSKDTLKYDGDQATKGYIEFTDGKPSSKMYINGYCVTVDKNNKVTSSKVNEEDCKIEIDKSESEELSDSDLYDFYLEEGDYIATKNRLHKYLGSNTSVTIPKTVTSAPYYYEFKGTECQDFFKEFYEEEGYGILTDNTADFVCHQYLGEDSSILLEMGFLEKKDGYRKISNVEFDKNACIDLAIEIVFIEMGETDFNENKDEYLDMLDDLCVDEKLFLNYGLSKISLYDLGVFKGDLEIISSTEELTTNIEEINDYTFEYKNITNVDFSENTNIKRILPNAFWNNQISGTLDLSILTELEYVSGFRYNQITDIILPTSVVTIDEDAFMGNQISGELDLSYLTNLKTIETWAFESNQIESIILPESITSVSGFGYNNFTGELDLSKYPNLKRITDSAFSDNEIESIKLPSLLTEIEYSVFSGNKIKSVILSNNITKVEDRAFFDNEIETLVLPDTLVEIGLAAFNKNNVTGEDAYIYERTDKNNDGIAEINTKKIIGYAGNQTDTIVINQEVTEIGDEAFAWIRNTGALDLSANTNLTVLGESAFRINEFTDIKLPSSIKVIKESAFTNSTYMKELDISHLTELTEISRFSFSSNFFSTINLPINITKIDTGAFSGNQLIGELDLTKYTKLKEIGMNAFNDYFVYDYLTSVKIPNNVEKIGTNAFEGYDTLTSITIDNVEGAIEGSPWGATNATINWLR